MKHFVMMLAVTVVCGAVAAQAQDTPPVQQTPPPPAQTPPPAKKPSPNMVPDGKMYLELVGGPTFGHKIGGSYGGEFGYSLTDVWLAFVETGWMGAAGTSDVDNRASAVADAIGGTAKTSTHAIYYDGGLSYRFPATGRFRPYASLGVGAASVSNKTRFSVNGADVTGQLDQFGVQLGNDLGGRYSAFFFTLGLGARVPFGSRWMADASYRYGRIGGNNKDQADIPGINTNRLQFGFGVRF